MSDYFQGDKIQKTGEIVDLYGGVFEKAIYLEGLKKGQELFVKAEKKGD